MRVRENPYWPRFAGSLPILPIPYWLWIEIKESLKAA